MLILILSLFRYVYVFNLNAFFLRKNNSCISKYAVCWANIGLTLGYKMSSAYGYGLDARFSWNHRVADNVRLVTNIILALRLNLKLKPKLQ